MGSVRFCLVAAGLFTVVSATALRGSPATKFYWAQTSDDAVQWANLDGTTVGPVVAAPDVGDAVGIAFDGLAGKVYWVESRALDDRILVANPDGSGLQTVVAWPDIITPNAIAVDPVSGKLCWTENHTTDSDDRIACAGLDGANPQPLITWPVVVNPVGLVIDPLASRLYWVERAEADDRVMRANLDGSGSQPIVSWPAVADPVAVAVDPLGGKLYWAQASASDDRIVRSNLDGSVVETIVSGPLVISPVGLAVDPIGGKVYWAEDQSFDDRIMRANFDGDGVEPVLSFLDVGDPVGIALDGTLADQPPVLLADATGITKNRSVSLSVVGGATVQSAIRVTYNGLPAPFSGWTNAELWVTSPGTACELAGFGLGQVCPSGTATFTSARLSCVLECRSDWSRFGTIHVRHQGIVPGASYRAEIVDCATDLGDPANYLSPLDLATPRWGDMVGTFAGGTWTGPNGNVEIVTDVVAGLEKFGNRGGAPTKSRADVEPSCVDLRVNITDVTRVLDAFRNQPYPFGPSSSDPCAAPCP